MKQPSAAVVRLQSRLLRTMDRIADDLGLFHYPLRADVLIELACRQEKLDDFGDWSFIEPLTVLVQAYENEAQLSTYGRIGVRWDMVRFLVNLLRLRAEEQQHPAILAEEITQPIFITGLPRSGTTFLHNLLAEDPANLVPRAWQTIFPYPRRGAADRRAELVARQFAFFVRLAPELPSLHPLDAQGAQECIEITGHVIRSLRFDTTHYVPSYASWLDQNGHLEAYRFHKRFLRHLQHQKARRGLWVLKSPDHIFALEALREVYPDARFIFVHREPLEVLSSTARLTEILRAPFTRTVNRGQIGEQVSTRWEWGAARLIEEVERDAGQSRIFNVRYRDLIAEPLAWTAEIYRHFAIPFSDDAKARMLALVTKHPDGRYGRNHYRLEDYGLDPQTERRRFDAYRDYFRLS